MYRTLTKTIVEAISMVLVVTSLAVAGGHGYDDSLTYEQGVVIAVDNTGLATIQTDRGVQYQVQDPGWQVGNKVDCTTQDGQTTCDHKPAFLS